MGPERWGQIERLYHAVLEHEGGGRAAFLEEACGGDHELRMEVESLLAQQEKSDSFLEAPALVAAARIVAQDQSGAASAADTMTGRTISHYHVEGKLGAGGMGVVYKAQDTRLGRFVALKFLPEALADDGERMARFRREAHVLASLNHPNIAAIYGLEESGGISALAMELVEGPTLGERIAPTRPLTPNPSPHLRGEGGPSSGTGEGLFEMLGIARQIAEALEYAHEHGVIHRDLKPANIKVTEEGTVKVLDFGLAKLAQPLTPSPSPHGRGWTAGPSEGVIDAPIASLDPESLTSPGMIMGTAAYMSPEQARGKDADRRTDIWAFGCVLYETLAGKQAFAGETFSDTLAAVLTNDPDWSQLPAGTPMQVRVLLKRCLQKDPKQRLRDIGDARISLDEVLAGAEPVAPGFSPAGASAGLKAGATRSRRIMPWALLGLITIALATLAFVHFRPKPSTSAAPMRFQIALPEKTSFVHWVSVSPDGRHLAFVAVSQDGRYQLWVRDLDSLVSRPLPGTERAYWPIWSPDSRALAFQAGDKLEKVDLSGGAPEPICNVANVLGGSWNPAGVIVFGGYDGLHTVSAAGGEPSLVIKADHSRGEHLVLNPSFLPDGRHFLYSESPAEEVYVGSLDAGTELRTAKPLVTGSMAAYAPVSGSRPGHILFLRPDHTLVAQTFDASRLELEGNPAVIAQGVADFTVSANGVLAYITGNEAPLELTWFDRQGKVLGTVGEPGIYPSPAISPDGNTVAVPRIDGAGGTDLWLYKVARGTRSRFTFSASVNLFPVWSPDGSRIAFLSAGAKTLTVYEKAVNGIGKAEAFQNDLSRPMAPLDWSRDGRYLIEREYGATYSIWVLLTTEKSGGERKSFPYLKEGISARLSPNGQWIAYDSDETGRDEIFVQTFPKPGGKWQVSIDGGTRPVWSRDGKELYFIGLDGNLMAVEVKSRSGGSFEAGAPKVLFNPHTGPVRTDSFDVTKEGRFLIPTMLREPGSPITVVVNWPALLKKQ